MTRDELIDNIQDEDFVIRIRPFADDDGQWSGELDISIMVANQSKDRNYICPKMSEDKLKDVELEIADVAIYLIRLADVLGVNISEVVRKKLAINESRF